MEWVEGPQLKEVVNFIIQQFSKANNHKAVDNVIPACNDSDDEEDQLVDLSKAEDDLRKVVK